MLFLYLLVLSTMMIFIIIFLYTFYPSIEMSVNHYIPHLKNALFVWFEDVPSIELYPSETAKIEKIKMKKKTKMKKNTFDADAFRFGGDLYIFY